MEKYKKEDISDYSKCMILQMAVLAKVTGKEEIFYSLFLKPLSPEKIEISLISRKL